MDAGGMEVESLKFKSQNHNAKFKKFYHKGTKTQKDLVTSFTKSFNTKFTMGAKD